MTELAPGTTLGPYRILSKLGEGGMGAVYRAHDSRLARDVAIKVSGERFSERFEREARVIAALNHTNVCHFYDVGPDCLVMELVEGEPPRGPLPLDQAVPILRQIIDGLDAQPGPNRHSKIPNHQRLDNPRSPDQ